MMKKITLKIICARNIVRLGNPLSNIFLSSVTIRSTKWAQTSANAKRNIPANLETAWLSRFLDNKTFWERQHPGPAEIKNANIK